MKNKNGFTLLELVAVIVVLGLIGLLVFPTIENMLKTTREDLYDAQLTTIKNAAKNWISDHPYDIPENSNDKITISLCQLKMGAYVDIKISNPITEKMFDCATKVIVSNDDNKYQYSINFNDTIEEEVPDEIIYPKVTLDDYLIYKSMYSYYRDSGVVVDGEYLTSSNDQYDYYVTTDIPNFNNDGFVFTIPNIYTMKYEITDKSTNIKTILYRTIIVR